MPGAVFGVSLIVFGAVAGRWAVLERDPIHATLLGFGAVWLLMSGGTVIAYTAVTGGWASG